MTAFQDALEWSVAGFLFAILCGEIVYVIWFMPNPWYWMPHTEQQTDYSFVREYPNPSHEAYCDYGMQVGNGYVRPGCEDIYPPHIQATIGNVTVNMI